MVTCLVIGDPHFKVTEMAASEEMGKEIIRISKERKPDFIVCLGDTLDRHESIHTEPLTAAIEWLGQLKEIAPLYLLIGNHDRINNSDFLSSKHPFVALKWWQGLTVVDKVIIDTIGGCNFFFVPYVPPGRLLEALETHPDWSPDGTSWSAGFTHQEIYGIKMGTIISEKGDHWPLDWPILINGHIHDRDVPQENVISVGTPRQHAFGEDPNKTLSLFTFRKEGSIDPSFHEERIPLNLPKKIIIRLTTQEFMDFQVPEECIDYLKLEIYGTSAELQGIMKLDKIKKLRKAGIKIVSKDTEAGAKKKRGAPLPEQIWQQTSFRDRLYYRVKEDPTVERVYQKIFGGKRVKITRKKG